jgi:uncharacterized membrane protein HdeD (DUF308 family)
MAKEEMCGHKGKGWMMLVLGLLILANAYWSIVDWAVFIGVIVALVGIGKVLMMSKN